MKTFLFMVQIISAALLVGLVIIHSAKGEGMGGIGGAARLFGTPKGMEEGLDKITAGCAVLFMAVSLILAIIK